MGKVATVGEVKRHDAVMGLEEAGVHLKVRRRPREGLNVHAPLSRVEAEGLERALLAKALRLIDEL